MVKSLAVSTKIPLQLPLNVNFCAQQVTAAKQNMEKSILSITVERIQTFLVIVCLIFMKILILNCLFLGLVSCSMSQRKQNAPVTNPVSPMSKKSIHEFTVTDIDGNSFAFNTLKGKKIMVVNTASRCGLTPQYKALETIYTQFKDSNFVIVGFPANNFMGQEPGSNEEIASFCSKNYGVTFPMMGKISVKGKDMHPLYKFLTSLAENGLEDNEVKWNFQKYLIDENGYVVRVIDPSTAPDDASIVSWITAQ